MLDLIQQKARDWIVAIGERWKNKTSFIWSRVVWHVSICWCHPSAFIWSAYCRTVIVYAALSELVKANKKKYGFTYTHKTKPTHLKENLKLIKWSNKNGFTINLSANNPEHADQLAKHGVPVAVVVGDKPIKKTPQGRPVAMCPYQKTKDSVDIITCDRCRLCQNSKRRSIVGFLTE
jgi:hypothetical protein